MAKKRGDVNGKEVYLVDAVRTPFLKSTSENPPFSASDLAVQAGRSLLLRNPSLPKADFDEVILGCVTPTPEEVNIARVVSIRIGFGKKIPAFTVQRNCASGMQALDSARINISSGRSRLVLAGGAEAMSLAPVLVNSRMTTWLGRFAKAKGLHKISQIFKLRPGHFTPVIGLLKGLTDHTVGLNMGHTAEIIAHRFNILRDEMDTFAMESHQKVANAHDEGHLREIVPVIDDKGNAYTADNGVRRDSNLKALAKLKPVFDKPFGSVTAGNSAQITDGSAMAILADEELVKERGLKPLARLIDIRWAGVEPSQMGLGPVNAIYSLLMSNKLKTSDIDYWEINEAFAGQVLAVLKAFTDPDYVKEEFALKKPFDPIPPDRLNVDGGAVALGHPVGASGARIVIKLANTLRDRCGRYGVASLCIGGGQGGAVLIEKVEE